MTTFIWCAVIAALASFVEASDNIDNVQTRFGHYQPNASEVSLWDKHFQSLPCLETMIDNKTVSLEEACSDDSSNRIKDDRGNLIRLTRWEDRVGLMVYEGVMRDCRQGQEYARDMVASWAQATSCFENETTLVGNETTNPEWYVQDKFTSHTNDGVFVIKLKDTKSKRICEDVGHSITSRTKLMAKQAELAQLVQRFDDLKANNTSEDGMKNVCKELFAAGNNKKFIVYELMDMTRPAACQDKESAVCREATKWLVDYLAGDLFTVDGKDGKKKGRDNGNNSHYKRCKDVELKHDKDTNVNMNTKFTRNAGITSDYPDCTVDGLNGTLWDDDGVNMGKFKFGSSNDMIGDAFRNCSVPFIGGPSGTIPKYLAWTAAGSKRTQFRKLPDKDLLMLLASIELGGHHSWTEMIFALNDYYNETKFTPPFDSGENNGKMNVRDECVWKGDSSGAYNETAYSAMMSEFQKFVKDTFAQPP